MIGALTLISGSRRARLDLRGADGDGALDEAGLDLGGGARVDQDVRDLLVEPRLLEVRGREDADVLRRPLRPPFAVDLHVGVAHRLGTPHGVRAQHAGDALAEEDHQLRLVGGQLLLGQRVEALRGEGRLMAVGIVPSCTRGGGRESTSM